MYGLHNKLQAAPGKGKELSDILLQASKLVFEHKCMLYMVSIDEGTPDAVWITEVWPTREDHDASLQLAGVRELIARAMPLIGEPPTRGQVLNVLGGLTGQN